MFLKRLSSQSKVMVDVMFERKLEETCLREVSRRLTARRNIREKLDTQAKMTVAAAIRPVRAESANPRTSKIYKKT